MKNQKLTKFQKKETKAFEKKLKAAGHKLLCRAGIGKVSYAGSKT